MTDIYESNSNFNDDVEDLESLKPSEEEIEKEYFESGIAETIGNNEGVPSENEGKTESAFVISQNDWEEIKQKISLYDDLEKRLTKTHDTAFGENGTLEQKLRELEGLKQVTPTPITKDVFKNTAEYFGDDDFAEKLAQDLAGLNFGGQGRNDELAALKEQFIQHQQATEEKLLTIAHPDWRNSVNKPEFSNEWYVSLNDEGKASVERMKYTWDGLEVAKIVTAFKTWEAKKAESEAKKQERLLAAIPAKNSGVTQRTSTLDAEDAFAAGLNSVTKTRKI